MTKYTNPVTLTSYPTVNTHNVTCADAGRALTAAINAAHAAIAIVNSVPQGRVHVAHVQRLTALTQEMAQISQKISPVFGKKISPVYQPPQGR